MSLLRAYITLGTGSCCSTSRHSELSTREKNKDPLKFAFWTAQLSLRKALFSEYPSQCKTNTYKQESKIKEKRY